MKKIETYIKNSISVTEKELDLILSCFHKMEAGKNQILMHRGEVTQRMYFVVEGCLRIYFIREDGQEVTRYLAFENQFATALVSFITGEPSYEYIESVEESKVCYISKHDFSVLLERIPQWETFYRKYLEIGYVNNTNRLKSFVVMDATERYRQLLKQDPIVVRRLPNKLVANYLNMSKETWSRIKKRLWRKP